MEKIFISTSFIKLDQFIKFSGYTETGGQAKEIVLQGLVKVNGELCISRGKKLHLGDKILIGDKEFEVCSR